VDERVSRQLPQVLLSRDVPERKWTIRAGSLGPAASSAAAAESPQAAAGSSPRRSPPKASPTSARVDPANPAAARRPTCRRYAVRRRGGASADPRRTRAWATWRRWRRPGRTAGASAPRRRLGHPCEQRWRRRPPGRQPVEIDRAVIGFDHAGGLGVVPPAGGRQGQGRYGAALDLHTLPGDPAHRAGVPAAPGISPGI
jgi:hypothetical protein